MSNDVDANRLGSPLDAYDALLVVSFGGPEAPDEVVPFLENVTRGSGIPRERLEVVGEHYFLFGGRSPINDQTKALAAAVDEELERRGTPLPVVLGNRNWRPYVTDAIHELQQAGHRKVLMLSTSAFPSYSGCRSYLESVAEALDLRGADIQVHRVGNYGLDSGFVAANAAAVRAARDELPGARIIFVTHSIPVAMNDTSGPESAKGAYLGWHRDTASQVMSSLGLDEEYDLVFCSRSGPPHQPWLEPDVNDHLEVLAESGLREVILAPIGFISDHMEVIYDLDTQARDTCADLGVAMVRAATAGTHPDFVAALVDRIEDRARRADSPAACDGGSCAGGCLGDCCPNLRRPDTAAID